MSSANDHLAPPPKPRMSPLDFRNTDLVSRLLAATPPYLYNMSLLPNTYFFSEMLRSLVQAKMDPGARQMPGGVLQTRRARKRPWTSTRVEPPAKAETPPKSDQQDWMLKSSFGDRKLIETPLELTTNCRIPPELDGETTKKLFSPNLVDRKENVDLPTVYSHNQEQASSLILPPPPPIWYPPLYPTAPYGIDPLHFFIDLRVSGHIYDRKNQRESNEAAEATSSSLKTVTNVEQFPKEGFKQSRHASAFSVPTSHMRTAGPINLSSEDNDREQETKKFDVKSMGLDKQYNKIGTNYIMNNIGNIYKTVNVPQVKNEEINEDNESEEQRQKRVKDLRALIGLELVVDYMNHAKPEVKKPNDNIADVESADSPAVEVVAFHDET